MDTLIIIYVVVSILVMLFQYWYITRLRRVIEFAIESLRRYASAMINDDKEEMERIDHDIKNYR